jgi:hypothetical protein
VVAALAAALLGGVGAGSAVPTAPGEPTLGPLISGTTSILQGAHVWTDYAYDDRAGAPGTRSATNGADLIQLQIRPTPDGLSIRAVLETLIVPAVPSVGLGIDLDADPATGAPGLPVGGWQVGGTPLGLERAVLVTEAGAAVFAWDGAAWATVADRPSAVDPVANTVDATVPWDDLPDLGPRWRVTGWAGPVGTEDGVHDLAYVRDTSTTNLQSNVQAAVLAGEADAALAMATIDLGAVATTTQLAQPVAGTKNTFLYRSALDLGEGIGPAVGNRHYAGPYQPYAVWFPEDLPPRPPLVVFLHGALSDHLSGSYGDDGSFVPGFPLGPGVIAPTAVIVTPLARGELAIGVDGPAEQDVLDVIDDVSTRFDVDDDRVVLSGYSMGGVGTFRLAQIYPDRWAGAVEFVGADDLGAISLLQEAGLVPFLGEGQSLPNSLENLRNLPFRMAHSRLDELELLIGGVQPDRAAAELQALGYDYRYWQFLARDHLTFPVGMVECEIDAAIARGRVHDPARVTYTQSPALVTDDDAVGLHLEHRGAYWVSGMVARGTSFAPGAEATVDVTSLARADRVPALQSMAGVEVSLGGRDVCGQATAAGTTDVWTLTGQAWVPGEAQPTTNGFTATLTGVAAVTLDAVRMALDPSQPIHAEITTDGPATVHLARACPDGSPSDISVDGGTAALRVTCPAPT